MSQSCLNSGWVFAAGIATSLVMADLPALAQTFQVNFSQTNFTDGGTLTGTFGFTAADAADGVIEQLIGVTDEVIDFSASYSGGLFDGEQWLDADITTLRYALGSSASSPGDDVSFDLEITNSNFIQLSTQTVTSIPNNSTAIIGFTGDARSETNFSISIPEPTMPVWVPGLFVCGLGVLGLRKRKNRL